MKTDYKRKRFLFSPISSFSFGEFLKINEALELTGLQLLSNDYFLLKIGPGWCVGRPVIGKGQVPQPFILGDAQIKEFNTEYSGITKGNGFLFSLPEEVKGLPSGHGIKIHVNSALDENNSFDLSFKMIEYVHSL